jgi:hypothetical protein
MRRLTRVQRIASRNRCSLANRLTIKKGFPNCFEFKTKESKAENNLPMCVDRLHQIIESELKILSKSLYTRNPAFEKTRKKQECKSASSTHQNIKRCAKSTNRKSKDWNKHRKTTWRVAIMVHYRKWAHQYTILALLYPHSYKGNSTPLFVERFVCCFIYINQRAPNDRG